MLKLLERFLSKPTEISYTDFEKVLNVMGYFVEKKKPGSHVIFINKETDIQITIPTVSGRTVKRIYMQKVIKLLSLEEWFEDNKETIKGMDEYGKNNNS